MQAELNALKAKLETNCIKGVQLIHIRLDAGIKCIRQPWHHGHQVLNPCPILRLIPLILVVPNAYELPLSLKRRNTRSNCTGSDH